MRIILGLISGASLFATACATTPNVRVNYFLPRADTKLTVTEVVTCDPQNHLVVVAKAQAATTYSASTAEADKRSVDIKGLDGPLADTGLTFEFYDDGRLKTVNATSTGKGGEILQSAIGLLKTVGGRGVIPPPEPTFKSACDKLKVWGKGEPITLTFEGALPLDTLPGQRLIDPDLASAARFGEIADALGYVCAYLDKALPKNGAGTILTKRRGDVYLGLKQPAPVPTSVFTNRSARCEKGSAQKFIWRDNLMVPQAGKDYFVPIPRAAAFGKQTFALTLAESGAVQKLQYDKETGVKQVIDVASLGAGELVTTRAESTARMNAESDEVAAMKRLAKCRAGGDC